MTLVFNNENRSSVGEKKLMHLADILSRCSGSTNKRSGGRHGKKGGPQGQKNLLFHSIWFNFHPANRHDNSIFEWDDSCWECVHGPQSGVEEFFTGVSTVKPVPKLYFPPYVFRQANLDAFANIVRVIRTYLPNGKRVPKKKVVELYGGVGTIGLNILDLVASLSCSDENPHNEKCFLKSLAGIKQEAFRSLSLIHI